ncbi:MAG: cyanophycin synthetase [Methylococcales bacterium]
MSLKKLTHLKQLYVGANTRIIDDTDNANASSLRVALETLADLPGIKILVLGDMAELGDDAQLAPLGRQGRSSSRHRFSVWVGRPCSACC